MASVAPAPETTRGETARLADFAAHTPFTELPAEAVERLEQCVLDFIGVAVLGAREADSSPAIQAGVARLSAGGGTARVVGLPGSWSMEHAALLNGVHAHSFDFDDTSIEGGLHPGAVVIPAALAAAEQAGGSGTEFLTALAVGYETDCRVGAALGHGAYSRGFHPTGVAGVFGAVAAAGRVLRLAAPELESAFGLAGSMAAGSMQYLANGGWNKRLHPGLAARNAVLAAGFAASGVSGASQAIEGALGLLHGYTDTPEPGRLTAELGERWQLTGTGIKPYPSCRLTHGAIDAALRLRERLGGTPPLDGDISILLSPAAYAIVGVPEARKISPINSVDAQFSVYFQAAAALLDGDVGWGTYRRVGEPETEKLAARITVAPDDAVTAAGARLTWHAPDGTDRDEYVPVPAGEPGTTLSWDVVETKFHSCTAALYDDATRHRIVAEVRRLHEAPSLRALTDLLAVDANV